MGKLDRKLALIDGWFAMDPDLRQGARAIARATKGERPTSDCDYFENFLAGGDQTSIARLGIDCDQSTGLGSAAAKAGGVQGQNTQNQILIMLAVAAALIIGVYWLT